MSTAGADLRCGYALHGVRVDVVASDPIVLDTVGLRLLDFRTGDAAQEATVRFEFVEAGGDEEGQVAATVGRPVYDTPHGSLSYVAESDLLHGELGGVQLRCEPDRGVVTIRGPRLRGRALYFATHPLTTVALMELMERRARYSLHAACLAGADGGGVLIAGSSGAGKSTLTLALARAGMSFLSDDVVFLARDGDAVAIDALGFADALGLTPYAAERFPELAARVADPPAEGFPKLLRRIEHLFGVSTTASCRPRALVFPEVAADQPSAIAPLDPGAALLRLVPDVLLTDPAATQAHLRAIAQLLEQVECYSLRSGADLERACELIRAVL